MAAQKNSRKKRVGDRLKFSLSYLSSFVFILIGACLIILATLNSTVVQSTPTSKIENLESKHEIKPVQLYIPKLAKILEISDGQVIDNRWTISQSGISYLTSSAKPGEVGNSVIYGHNKRDILGGLPYLVRGDLIYVVMSDGKSIKYEVFETREIKPTQVEILNQTEDKRLTIYTCTGFLDQARFVLISRQVEI